MYQSCQCLVPFNLLKKYHDYEEQTEDVNFYCRIASLTYDFNFFI